MSDRTLSVLQFIFNYRNERGVSPTYREIGRACLIRSTSNVRYHLDKLERKKLLKRFPGVSRGIVLLDKAHEFVAATY